MEGLEHCTSDEQLLRRIRGEYSEMPGLRLTCEQAQRLWGLDAVTCARLLKNLVDTRFLQRSPDGRYGQIGDGSFRRVPVRMLKADIVVDSSQNRPSPRTNPLHGLAHDDSR